MLLLLFCHLRQRDKRGNIVEHFWGTRTQKKNKIEKRLRLFLFSFSDGVQAGES
jgi:hypothetical protein